jgi:hypothetical protein
MRTTRYFEEQVLRKRPYRRRDWCLLSPVASVTQADGRIRGWVRVDKAPPDGKTRFLRIVLLEDDEPVLNAFFDRTFTPPEGETP